MSTLISPKPHSNPDIHISYEHNVVQRAQSKQKETEFEPVLLEKKMAAHSSILRWRIPWQAPLSMGLQESDMT